MLSALLLSVALCHVGSEPGIVNQDAICVTPTVYESWYTGTDWEQLIPGYEAWVWAEWWPHRDELESTDVRGLIEHYFPASEWDNAMRVAQCESGLDPNAWNRSDPHGGAKGVFQHLADYFPARAKAAGFEGASPFDAEANVAAAAWLWEQSGWRPWSCARRLGIG